MHLRDNEGYISYLIAHESSLGTLTCPWSIEAKSSQSIKLSVFDFGSFIKSETDGTWTRINYSARDCPTSLSVEEVSTGESKRLALCGGVRYRHLYTSNTHHLRLHFTTLSSYSELPYFLVKYESKCHFLCDAFSQIKGVELDNLFPPTHTPDGFYCCCTSHDCKNLNDTKLVLVFCSCGLCCREASARGNGFQRRRYRHHQVQRHAANLVPHVRRRTMGRHRWKLHR